MMNSPMNVTSEEWDRIEIYLNQKDVLKTPPIINENLAQIPNVAEKIKHVNKTRQEIENCIRQSKIKDFHKYTLMGVYFKLCLGLIL